MQGYILNIIKVRDEDLIVNILTKKHLTPYYRFYGARHSVINIGYKIDFNSEINAKNNIGRLSNVTHLSFSWIKEINIMFLWQKFINLLYNHIKDIDELDSFYFKLLDSMIDDLSKQNPKRTLLISYIKLLLHEGRYNINNLKCNICDNPINKNNYYIARSFIPTHKGCNKYAIKVDYNKLINMFETLRSVEFNDDEIEKLFTLYSLGF